MRMSLTVSRQAGADLAERRDREQNGGLHLDSEDAPVRPALLAALVGVVKGV